jgi:hypothetical protein
MARRRDRGDRSDGHRRRRCHRADGARARGHRARAQRPQPLTPGDQIKTLAAVLERPLRYEPLTDEQARAEMAADTPTPVIDAFFRFFSDGEYDDSAVLDTVQRITGRPPRSFEQ